MGRLLGAASGDIVMVACGGRIREAHVKPRAGAEEGVVGNTHYGRVFMREGEKYWFWRFWRLGTVRHSGVPSDTTMALGLFCYWRSSCSYRVRIALEMKALKYTYHTRRTSQVWGKDHQIDDEYARDVNPMRQVPTLVDGGVVITQSVAIMEYVEDKFAGTGPRLMPDNAVDRAFVRKLVEIVNSGTQPFQSKTVLGKVEAAGIDPTVWAREAISKGLAAFEDELAMQPGRKSTDFCVGSSVTLADCVLVPQLFNARLFMVDLKNMPIILGIDARFCALPAFLRAHPHNQPDSPAHPS